jgi:hypothetical protein
MGNMNVTDSFISRVIKRSVNKQKPPASIRVSLLEKAAQPRLYSYAFGVFSFILEPSASNQIYASHRLPFRRNRSADWTQNLNNWSLVCSFDTNALHLKLLM